MQSAQIFALLLTLSLLLGVMFAVSSLLLYRMLQMSSKMTEKLLVHQQMMLTELMNRLMSPDLRTFNALQRVTDSTSISSSSEDLLSYIPKSDEGEVKQLRDMAGYGEMITNGDDDDFAEFSADLGLLGTDHWIESEAGREAGGLG